MVTVGIDIGSITAKAAVMRDGSILAVRILRTGYNAKNAGDQLFEGIVSGLGMNPSDIQGIVATGYGRKSITFADQAVTEITCHAAGARYMNPEIRSVIDIGGQDSKVILLDETGRVKDFAMNDKCAAGTGRFLEVMARALEVEHLGFWQPLAFRRSSGIHQQSVHGICGIRGHFTDCKGRKPEKHHCRHP